MTIQRAIQVSLISSWCKTLKPQSRGRPMHEIIAFCFNFQCSCDAQPALGMRARAIGSKGKQFRTKN